MPSCIPFAGMGRSTASSSQGPRTPILPTMSAAPREQATQPSQVHQPMAADHSSDSGNTIPYEDQDMHPQEGGGDAAFGDRASFAPVGTSDDSMSHATEAARPKRGAVTLTIEQESDSSGNTEFYEDPMQQDSIRNAAAKSSRGTSSIQGQVAMPPEERNHQPTLVMTSPMGDQSLIAPPMLPLARPNPGKRSGSDDIERERPLRTRTPSPQARIPPRPASSQLPRCS